MRQDKDNFEIQAIKVNLTDIDATSKMWTQDEYIHGLLTRHFPFYLFRQEGIIFFPRTLMFLATHITLPLSLYEKEKRRAGKNYESPIQLKMSKWMGITKKSCFPFSFFQKGWGIFFEKVFKFVIVRACNFSSNSPVTFNQT